MPIFISSVTAARPQPVASIRTSVALVHDYLTQKGGAERVLLSMHRAFPEAPIYTSLFQPDTTFTDFRDADVRVLPLDRVSILRRNHRLALPLLPIAFSALRVRANVVICSSSGWAHGVRTDGRKIVYCYTPARWLYQTDRYLGQGRRAARLAIRLIRPLLVRWDRKAARSAHRYLTQSTIVRERIHAAYGIDAEMLPGPHTFREDGLSASPDGLQPGYFLVVSRLLPYKNLDAVVSAFRKLPGARLVVAGMGPEAANLMAGAGPNVNFLGSVSDAQLAWLYANCLGVIAAAYEDYGLVPLEAAAFGKPTAAFRWGGFLDTVVEGRTGTFFDAPTSSEISEAVTRLQTLNFDPRSIRVHAAQYSEERFIEKLRGIVAAEAARG
jgi:glycosyltransferase involved in cell wall biosynthesis